MQAGAEVDNEDKNGWTPLCCAASNGHTECARRLLQVCVTCSCVALPPVPSADQITLYCLYMTSAPCEWVSIPILLSTVIGPQLGRENLLHRLYWSGPLPSASDTFCVEEAAEVFGRHMPACWHRACWRPPPCKPPTGSKKTHPLPTPTFFSGRGCAPGGSCGQLLYCPAPHTPTGCFAFPSCSPSHALEWPLSRYGEQTQGSFSLTFSLKSSVSLAIITMAAKPSHDFEIFSGQDGVDENQVGSSVRRWSWSFPPDFRAEGRQ